MTASHYGLMVHVMRTERNSSVFAEVVPASPLICWVGFTRQGLRKYFPFRRGRSWKEPQIRWWFEIHETELPGEFGELGTHWHTHDGGAMSLRGAMQKTGDAVDAVVELIRCEAKIGGA